MANQDSDFQLFVSQSILYQKENIVEKNNYICEKVDIIRLPKLSLI